LSTIITGDLDALHARAAAQGAKVTNPANGTDYGPRDFEIQDAEGNS
jgi:uncharacterized glyoxalase superfamily protein PhnB